MGTMKSLAAVSLTAASLLALHKTQAHAQIPKHNNPTNHNSQNTIKSAAKPKIVQVKRGDTLSVIAAQQKTTWRRLFDANTSIKNPNLIYPGEILNIAPADQKLVQRPWPAAKASSATPQPSVAPTLAQNPAPAPSQPSQALAAPVAGAGVWQRIAGCESGGNWNADTGNGYYGGLQFSLGSWHAVGGRGYPNQANRAQQIARAKILQARQGWGAWPVCSHQAGV
ncbi:MAG: transglycosylase family protein [Candidatus Saccharimonadales bacterium]